MDLPRDRSVAHHRQRRVGGTTREPGRTAATDARTISGLYQELDRQYQQQRTVAETLQRALLPTSNPAFAELDSASRYVAGAAGVDIGGDWYSVLAVDAMLAMRWTTPTP